MSWVGSVLQGVAKRQYVVIREKIDHYNTTPITEENIIEILDLIECVKEFGYKRAVPVLNEVVHYLRSCLLSTNTDIVFHTLVLLDCIVKNSGFILHIMIGRRKFMKTMSLVARRSIMEPSLAKQKVGLQALDCLQAWGEAFYPREQYYPYIYQTYLKLRNKYKIRFPRRDFDPTRVPIFLPALSTEEKAMASAFNNNLEVNYGSMSSDEAADAAPPQATSPHSNASQSPPPARIGALKVPWNYTRRHSQQQDEELKDEGAVWEAPDESPVQEADLILFAKEPPGAISLSSLPDFNEAAPVGNQLPDFVSTVPAHFQYHYPDPYATSETPPHPMYPPQQAQQRASLPPPPPPVQYRYQQQAFAFTRTIANPPLPPPISQPQAQPPPSPASTLQDRVLAMFGTSPRAPPPTPPPLLVPPTAMPLQAAVPSPEHQSRGDRNAAEVKSVLDWEMNTIFDIAKFADSLTPSRGREAAPAAPTKPEKPLVGTARSPPSMLQPVTLRASPAQASPVLTAPSVESAVEQSSPAAIPTYPPPPPPSTPPAGLVFAAPFTVDLPKEAMSAPPAHAPPPPPPPPAARASQEMDFTDTAAVDDDEDAILEVIQKMQACTLPTHAPPPPPAPPSAISEAPTVGWLPTHPPPPPPVAPLDVQTETYEAPESTTAAPPPPASRSFEWTLGTFTPPADGTLLPTNLAELIARGKASLTHIEVAPSAPAASTQLSSAGDPAGMEQEQPRFDPTSGPAPVRTTRPAPAPRKVSFAPPSSDPNAEIRFYGNQRVVLKKAGSTK